MRKIFLFSLLSNISIFAQNSKIEPTITWIIPWLLTSFAILGLFFWSIYKTYKTKNVKYGYVIFLSLFLMVGMLFI